MTTGIAAMQTATNRSCLSTLDRESSQRGESRIRKAIGVILAVAVLSVTVQASNVAPAMAASTPRADVYCNPAVLDSWFSLAPIAVGITGVDQTVVETYARVWRWDLKEQKWVSRDYWQAARGMDILKDSWTLKGSWYHVEVWIRYYGASNWVPVPQVMHWTRTPGPFVGSVESSNRTDICHL